MIRAYVDEDKTAPTIALDYVPAFKRLPTRSWTIKEKRIFESSPFRFLKVNSISIILFCRNLVRREILRLPGDDLQGMHPA